MDDTTAVPITIPDWSGLVSERNRLAAEVDRLRAGIQEIIDDGTGPCSFFACPGPDHPMVGMATCNVCYPHIALRELLGEVLTCTAVECIACGRESPWCEECDAKIIECEHAPADD